MNTRDTFWKNTKKADGIQHTTKFTPRIPELQSMNGMQIKTGAAVSQTQLAKLDYKAYNSIKWLFEANKLDMYTCIITGKVGEKNLGKWLTHSHIPEAMASLICSAKVPSSELTLTTRYKDFARMSSSEHFSTCATNDYIETIAYYLHKPNVFMLVDRGDNGYFKTRVIGRLTRITNHADAMALCKPVGTKIIIFNRIYGIAQVTLPEEINGIPCFCMEPKDIEGKNLTTRGITDDLVSFEVGPEQVTSAHYANKIYDDLVRNPTIVLPDSLVKKLNEGWTGVSNKPHTAVTQRNNWVETAAALLRDTNVPRVYWVHMPV